MDELQLEGVAGEGKVQGSSRGGRDPRPAGLEGEPEAAALGRAPAPTLPTAPRNQLGMQGLGKGQPPQDFKLLVPRGKKQASDTEMKKRMQLAGLSEIPSLGQGREADTPFGPLGIRGTKKSSAGWS